MKDLDVNKLSSIIGLVIIAITSVVSFNNAFHQIEELSQRAKKADENSDKVSDQLKAISKQLDWFGWNMEAVKKDMAGVQAAQSQQQQTLQQQQTQQLLLQATQPQPRRKKLNDTQPE